jgi:hypothetical protein
MGLTLWAALLIAVLWESGEILRLVRERNA